MVDMAHIAGLIAGGAHPSPFPHAHVVTSTTQKSLRGPRGGFILSTADLARKIDFAVFPYMQGGPLMHIIAAKARLFRRGPAPRLCPLRPTGGGKRRGDGYRGIGGGTKAGVRRHREPPYPGGPDAHGHYRPTGGRRPWSRWASSPTRTPSPFDPRPPRVASGMRLGTPPSPAGALAKRRPKKSPA